MNTEEEEGGPEHRLVMLQLGCSGKRRYRCPESSWTGTATWGRALGESTSWACPGDVLAASSDLAPSGTFSDRVVLLATSLGLKSDTCVLW